MVGTATTITDAGSVLVNTITLILDDPTFSIQSAPAVHNRKLAQHLVKWMPDHKDINSKKNWSNCFLHVLLRTQQTKAKTTREKVWTAYYKWHLSKTTHLCGRIIFLVHSDSSMLPILCQHVGHEVLKKLINHYPVSKVSVKEPAKFDPTYEELSEIRYASGWVVNNF